MTIEFEELPKFFAEWVAVHGSVGACAEVAAWLASGELDPDGFSEIVRRHAVSREPWFRLNMLDLVLDYARRRLSERLLTIDDVADIRMLTHALHVKDGDFIEHRPNEVSGLIQMTLDALRADDRIRDDQELYLVSIQAAFDLSYDQFLRLGRASLERVIAELEAQIAVSEPLNSRELSNLTRKRAALAPIRALASLHHRSLGALH